MNENRIARVHYALMRGDFALDARFTLPLGGITGLFGASGSGKTTLLRCMAGLEQPATGEFAFGEQPIDADGRGLPAHRRRIACVFQDARLFATYDVRGNLTYGQRRAGTPTLNFDEVVAMLELAPLLERRVDALSGGEAQRVAIGRALLAGARMVLLDEPVASLDAAGRQEVLDCLERLHRRLDLPMVYVSHDIGEICRFCDYLVVLAGGTVAAAGELTALLTRTDLPGLGGSEAGCLLRGTVVAFDERWQLSRVRIAGAELQVPGRYPAGTPLRLRVRANDVSLAAEDSGQSSILNRVAARIERVDDDSAHAVIVHLDAGGERLLARITRRSLSELALEPGQSVIAQIKSVSVRSGFD